MHEFMSRSASAHRKWRSACPFIPMPLLSHNNGLCRTSEYLTPRCGTPPPSSGFRLKPPQPPSATLCIHLFYFSVRPSVRLEQYSYSIPVQPGCFISALRVYFQLPLCIPPPPMSTASCSGVRSRSSAQCARWRFVTPRSTPCSSPPPQPQPQPQPQPCPAGRVAAGCLRPTKQSTRLWRLLVPTISTTRIALFHTMMLACWCLPAVK